VIDLTQALARHFGHPAFRPGQEAVVRAVIEGADVLAVMPTGAGKSIGFQLPALLLPGVTLVVSPLISLMKDQVDELNRRGIPAAAIHSLLSPGDRRDALKAAEQGRLRLLYVAPERFASDRFTAWLARLPVARFVVDEAHCVSEWGHDFRPDYRRLADAAAACRRGDGEPGRPPLAAFTATATPEVRDDVVGLLGLKSPRVSVAGFDRPNIELAVTPVSGEAEKHALLPGLIGRRRALVYASTRRGAEAAADALRQRGLDAAAYHAGLVDAERTRVQDAFVTGSVQVVCATNAFGMGIDRPDIEVVVHADVPGSIDAYYQEIGRAGRDGRRAVATLLWSYADVKTREFLIERDRDADAGRPTVPVDPAELERRKQLERAKLRRMVAYADASRCLRATILRYFGDPAAREPCGACSNCARRARLDPAQVLRVRKILSGIARAGERYGKRKVAAMLVGRVDDLPEPLTRLSTTGILGAEPLADVERWIDAVVAGALARESQDQYRVLSLTPAGREVMAGREPAVELPIPRLQAAKARRTGKDRRRAASPRDGTVPRLAHAGRAAPHEGVAEVLRAWRMGEARRRAIAPFVILHDRTLLEIAARLPQTLDDLGTIHGIGRAKLGEYGATILSVVLDALRTTTAEPAERGAPSTEGRPSGAAP
jgi:ATP-dependent DNA helicase RecQ